MGDRVGRLERLELVRGMRDRRMPYLGRGELALLSFSSPFLQPSFGQDLSQRHSRAVFRSGLQELRR